METLTNTLDSFGRLMNAQEVCRCWTLAHPGADYPTFVSDELREAQRQYEIVQYAKKSDPCGFTV